MMNLQGKRSRLIELALLFFLILTIFLLSLLAPTDPDPPLPTPWRPGASLLPTLTPTAAPAWWQDFPTPFMLYPTQTGDAHDPPTQP